MTQSYRFVLKLEQDGCGFYYGHFDVGDESYRIDCMPPKSEPRPFFVHADATRNADPNLWIINVNGEEIARVPTRAEIEPMLVARLVANH